MDGQNIPCATLKRRGSWVISVLIYLFKTFISNRVNELPEEFLYDPVSKSYGDPSRYLKHCCPFLSFNLHGFCSFFSLVEPVPSNQCKFNFLNGFKPVI